MKHTIFRGGVPMESILQKMKKDCIEAKQQLPNNDTARLQDVAINTQTGDIKFIWTNDQK